MKIPVYSQLMPAPFAPCPTFDDNGTEPVGWIVIPDDDEDAHYSTYTDSSGETVLSYFEWSGGNDIGHVFPAGAALRHAMAGRFGLAYEPAQPPCTCGAAEDPGWREHGLLCPARATGQIPNPGAAS